MPSLDVRAPASMASSLLSPSSEGSLGQAEEKVRLRVSYGGTFVLVRLALPGGRAARRPPTALESRAASSGDAAPCAGGVPVEAVGSADLFGERRMQQHICRPVLEAWGKAWSGLHSLCAAR